MQKMPNGTKNVFKAKKQNKTKIKMEKRGWSSEERVDAKNAKCCQGKGF